MKRDNRRRRGEEGISFWQSSSDLMTGLILILLLIIALLVLQMMYTPASKEGDVTNGESAGTALSAQQAQHEGAAYAVSGNYHRYDTEGSGGGSGGGGTNNGDYEYKEESGKSAVYVKVVDAETKQLIQKKGISFNLLRYATQEGNGALQTLNTYYPKKISYTQFETTNRGVFYLPEKISLGRYAFIGLTAPKGYDPAEKTAFTIDQVYDWPNPYVLEIPLSPSKNVIRIRLRDASTQKGVGGAVFSVIAAEDITTLDGTVRCKQGAVAGTITTGENGVGESKELYLGKYTLQETTIPPYYALITDSTEHEVKQKTSSAVKAEAIETSRTTIRITLTDELDGSPISGAEFEVSSTRGDSQTIRTDANGKASLNTLQKHADYTIHQISTAEGYYTSGKDTTFRVDENGLIGGKAAKSFALTNYQIHMSIGVVDTILRSEISGQNVSLYTSSGRLVSTWTTSGERSTFTDLTAGSYYLTVGGSSTHHEFTVRKTGEAQSFSVSVITWRGILAVVLGIGLVAALIALLRFFLRRRPRKGEDEGSE